MFDFLKKLTKVMKAISTQIFIFLLNEVIPSFDCMAGIWSFLAVYCNKWPFIIIHFNGFVGLF